MNYAPRLVINYYELLLQVLPLASGDGGDEYLSSYPLDFYTHEQLHVVRPPPPRLHVKVILAKVDSPSCSFLLLYYSQYRS